MSKDSKVVENITDFPTVNFREAGYIFGWSKAKFYLKFKQGGFKERLRHGREGTGHRTSILLMDVIRLAFPEADRRTQYLMAVEFQNFRASNRINDIIKLRERRKNESESI